MGYSPREAAAPELPKSLLRELEPSQAVTRAVRKQLPAGGLPGWPNVAGGNRASRMVWCCASVFIVTLPEGSVMSPDSDAWWDDLLPFWLTKTTAAPCFRKGKGAQDVSDSPTKTSPGVAFKCWHQHTPSPLPSSASPHTSIQLSETTPGVLPISFLSL